MEEGKGYAILETLARGQTEYADGKALADATGQSIRDVEEGVAHLLRLGVPVERHPAYGFRLPIPFDLIDRDEVRSLLSERGWNWQVHGALEVGSTNDLINEAGASGSEDGTTWFAEYQSKGRGRLDRKWHSPVGAGLWFSILRHHDLRIEDGWQVTLGTGVAVATAIEVLTGLEPGLKWPNDVQIDGLKTCGILTESRSERGRLTRSTIGVGVNVHLETSEFPPELRSIATSIHEAGETIRRTDLLVEILTQLNQVLAWSPEQIRSAWQARCQQWGKRVRVEQGDDSVEGKAVELAENGAFVVEKDLGERFSVHSGDVTHLRTLS